MASWNLFSEGFTFGESLTRALWSPSNDKCSEAKRYHPNGVLETRLIATRRSANSRCLVALFARVATPVVISAMRASSFLVLRLRGVLSPIQVGKAPRIIEAARDRPPYVGLDFQTPCAGLHRPSFYFAVE